MNNKVIGFYSSKFSEENSIVYSLGGGPDTLLGMDFFPLFSTINEYKSISGFRDYRIIYIKNLFNENVTVSNPRIFISLDSSKYLDKVSFNTLTKIQLRLFVPDYCKKNFIHPKINKSGFIQETETSLINLINTQKTPLNYGSSINIRTELNRGDFFPIVIERNILGTLPFINKFEIIFNSTFGVAG